MSEHVIKFENILSKYLSTYGGDTDTTIAYNWGMVCSLILLLIALHSYGPIRRYMERGKHL
jgi:hypothetical protein